MTKKAEWIQNGRIYNLVDSHGKVLYTVEDRTCNGNSVTKEILEKYKNEYFEEKKGS
ncbi:hypothetical protein [Cytobacillus gottheilii]|uniref:hypothetical protein n=1 Tax=Cytobacillus gottheilii TaxID=859144 RepID=UPI000B2A3AA2|nr:hypothetical protein [Cytobacillus gottheilii]